MSSAYPHFQPSYTHEELVEHFLLTPADLQLVLACRGEANRCGMALLLKALPYLGYVPDDLAQIPSEVRAFVTGQLGLLWDHSEHYPWPSRTWDQHIAFAGTITNEPEALLFPPQGAFIAANPGSHFLGVLGEVIHAHVPARGRHGYAAAPRLSYRQRAIVFPSQNTPSTPDSRPR